MNRPHQMSVHLKKSFTKNKRVMCVFRVHVLLTLVFVKSRWHRFAFNHRMFEFSFAFSPRTKITIDVFGEKQMSVAEKRPVKAFIPNASATD